MLIVEPRLDQKCRIPFSRKIFDVVITKDKLHLKILINKEMI